MNPIAKLLSGPSLARSVLEVSSQPVVVASESGTILFANQHVQNWFGYAESEITGSTLGQLFPADGHRDRDAQSVPELSHDTPTRLKGGRQRVLCKDGAELIVDVSFIDVQEQCQSLILANFSKADPDDASQNLLESERLDAVAMMIGGLAHESRNALQRAVACLDLMELDLVDDARHMELTAKIRKSLSDLLDNYNEVKRFAEPISLQRSCQRVMPLCREAFYEVEERRGQSGNELMLSDNPTCDDTVNVDADRIKEVFRHVIENALDQGQLKMTILVECESAHLENRPALRIMVYDDGRSFSKEALVRAFEPFYTTKQHGTGLGLSISRRIVQTHGGTIQVGNPERGGAVVEIILPQALDPVANEGAGTERSLTEDAGNFRAQRFR